MVAYLKDIVEKDQIYLKGYKISSECVNQVTEVVSEKLKHGVQEMAG